MSEKENPYISKEEAKRLLDAINTFEKDPKLESFQGLTKNELREFLQQMFGVDGPNQTKKLLNLIASGQINTTQPEKILEDLQELGFSKEAERLAKSASSRVRQKQLVKNWIKSFDKKKEEKENISTKTEIESPKKDDSPEKKLKETPPATVPAHIPTIKVKPQEKEVQTPSSKETLSKGSRGALDQYTTHKEAIKQVEREIPKIKGVDFSKIDDKNLLEEINESPDLYLSTKEEVPTISLSEKDQETLKHLIADAHENPSKLAKRLSREIETNIDLSYSQNTTKEDVKSVSELAARSVVSKLLDIEAGDVQEKMSVFNPNEMLASLANVENLKEVKDPNLQKIISLAASDVWLTSTHDDAMSQILTTPVLGAGISNLFFLGKDYKPRKFEVSTKKSPLSSSKASVQRYREYAKIRWQVQGMIKDINPDLILSDKDYDKIVRDVFKLRKAQYLNSGYNLLQIRYLAGMPTETVNFYQDQQTMGNFSLGFISPVANLMKPGVNWNFVISSETNLPMVNFGFNVGPKNFKVFNVGSAFKKTSVEAAEKQLAKTVGKAVAKEGGKQLAKTAAKKGIITGIKATISSVGETLGPIGHVIVYAVITALQKLAEKTIGFLKKHRELLFVPVVAAGFALGSPLLIAGGSAALIITTAGSIAAALSIIAGFIFSIFSAAIAALVGPFIIVTLGTIFFVAAASYIIYSGAYVVPPYIPIDEDANPYLSVTKIANPAGPFENSVLEGEGLSVTYTITISPKQGTLDNSVISYECSVNSENSNINCPDPDPEIPSNWDTTISSTISFTYTQIYTSGFENSSINDTITVSGVHSTVGETSESATAEIIIGEAPEGGGECPSGCPVKGTGCKISGYWARDCRYWTHCGREAVDLKVNRGQAVFATHDGTVTQSAYEPYGYAGFGNIVEIQGKCEGKKFVSQYAHLLTMTVKKGKKVKAGDKIGTGNSTGNSSGNHVHYEFWRHYWSLTPTGPAPKNPPYMKPPYFPFDAYY